MITERTVLCLAALLCGQLALAADRISLTQGQDVVDGPSIVRVAAVFSVVCALAIAVIVVLRRYLPQFSSSTGGAAHIQVIERASLLGGTRIHLVDVDGHKVLIADGRAGIAVTVIDKQPTAPDQ